MVSGLRAQWIVAHVETPSELRWPKERRDFIVDVIGFAQDMGAETVALQGIRVADEILALAQQRNVSRILVGKPGRPRWRQIIEGSVVETLVRRSHEIDVYVISGEAEGETPERASMPTPSSGWAHYLQAVGVVLIATSVAYLMHSRFELTNLVMVYLLGVMVVALWLGRGPGILASILSVGLFDFLFVPPRFTLAVSDTQYLITFAVMLIASLSLSTMASWLRVQTDAARRRELRTGALYRHGREFASLRTADEVLAAAARTLGEEFEGRAAVLLPDAAGRLRHRVGDLGPPQLERHEEGVAQWVFDNGHPAGVGTDTLPAAHGLYVPLNGSRGPIGVVGLSRPGGPLRPDQFRFLEAMASQVALAVERGQLAEQAEQTRVQVESERLKNTLLSSVSHDFRTPLAVITGAATSLLERADLPDDTRQELTRTIADEAERLGRQVNSLLDMTRLESGALQVHKEWHSLEEVVGAALERFGPALAGRAVRVDVAAVPFAPLDDILMTQVVFNLVENTLKYTPPDGPIEIRAARERHGCTIEISDRGPGVPEGAEQRVFEKFYRAVEPGSPRGMGLGLAICKGMVEAHGGTIAAVNRAGGGLTFRIWLPIEGQPPELGAEDGASPPERIAGES
jgi:two-component system sensor histidine kinase KdpD